MEERNRPGEVSGRPAVEEWQVYHARHIPELEALNRLPIILKELPDEFLCCCNFTGSKSPCFNLSLGMLK